MTASECPKNRVTGAHVCQESVPGGDERKCHERRHCGAQFDHLFDELPDGA